LSQYKTTVKHMKTTFLKNTLAIGFLAISLSACFDYEDEGPLQYQEESFSITDFERLEIGDAFIIRVTAGNYFSIDVRGDRRNLDDLEVYKSGSTLVVRYDEYENRRHETYIDIVMPEITAAVFSGATNSVISGFEELELVNISLSGASVSQVDIETAQLNLNLSGASVVDLRGAVSTLYAEVSGASSMKAFTMPAANAILNVSGASVAKVNVSDNLEAVISGASTVIYRGNPVINQDLSGGSSLQRD
jgi:Putative auto-transporter adhesin, head GIN domain